MQPQYSSRTKIAFSAAFILAIIAYVFWQTMSGSPTVVTTVAGTAVQFPKTANSGGPTLQSTTAFFRNGSYTGKATDAFYGIVQVKAVVQGGKLADVQFLQYPSDRQHSLELSSMAMPILTQEAISAQRAQVDIVSGATQTSEAFQASLASALTQAKG